MRLVEDDPLAHARSPGWCAELVDRLHPEHAGRVAETFAALDDAEKRQLAALCGTLAA